MIVLVITAIYFAASIGLAALHLRNAIRYGEVSLSTLIIMCAIIAVGPPMALFEFLTDADEIIIWRRKP